MAIDTESGNVTVATYLKPEMLADVDECAAYYQSSRAAVMRMALVDFLAAWRRRIAPVRPTASAGDLEASVGVSPSRAPSF